MRRLALLLAPLALAACTHSTPVAKAVAQPSPYGVVMVATLAPGSSLDGTIMERLARMPGVGATGGRPGTFRVVVRAHATVEQYLAARRALAAVPGVARIATTTSTGTSLDR